MARFDFLKFATDEDLAEAAAGQWLDLLAVGATVSSSAALSGGRIAHKFFSALARTAGAAKKLATVHFFWGDERCVAPDDPESNFGIANELLFSPLKIAAKQIHRIKGEIAPEQAAREAETELEGLVAKSSDGLPIIDLIFLGMGEDGHVASLFPTEPEEMRNNPAVYRPVIASKPPPRRITLRYGPIVAAREVWVLASGAGKEKALRDSLSPTGATPLARVLQRREQTRIFTDIKV
jgi:6-phosphogluconolactonase